MTKSKITDEEIRSKYDLDAERRVIISKRELFIMDVDWSDNKFCSLEEVIKAFENSLLRARALGYPEGLVVRDWCPPEETKQQSVNLKDRIDELKRDGITFELEVEPIYPNEMEIDLRILRPETDKEVMRRLRIRERRRQKVDSRRKC